MKARKNRYAGVLEKWKVDLAVGRIRAFGFPRDQWDDLMQGLVSCLIDFQFTPDKFNGAKESTALCALVNYHLISIQRTSHRKCEGLVRYLDRLGLTVANADRHPLFVEDDRSNMRLDVQLAVSQLSAEQRVVCAGLARGDSIRQIAIDQGCSWRAVQRIVAEIRRHFIEIGLDGWVCGQ